MQLKQKYLKCFTNDKAEQLKQLGYTYLYDKNGVYYFQNNENLTIKFSDNDILNGVKQSMTINL
jgi:hypothetical protein